jgi:hypothetical protein
MRSIVILFLLVGICLVVVGYVQSNQACPPPVVEFRYLPQTFEQEQNLQQPQNPIPFCSILILNKSKIWEVYCAKGAKLWARTRSKSM